MSRRNRWAIWLLPLALATPMPGLATPACPALLQHQLLRLQDEKPVDLCAHAGKVLLEVNTASQCGFIRQYKALQALHQRLAARALVVLGFPSNDFGPQEPCKNEAIADFCKDHVAVRFSMFAKSTIKAGDRGAIVNQL